MNNSINFGISSFANPSSSQRTSQASQVTFSGVGFKQQVQDTFKSAKKHDCQDISGAHFAHTHKNT